MTALVDVNHFVGILCGYGHRSIGVSVKPFLLFEYVMTGQWSNFEYDYFMI